MVRQGTSRAFWGIRAAVPRSAVPAAIAAGRGRVPARRVHRAAVLPATPQLSPDRGPLVLGVLICYESIFPELARKQVSQGATLLVNISNDAWFGRSSAPEQHLSLGILRAVEQRRWIARSTNTRHFRLRGPDGGRRGRSGLFKAESPVAPGRPADGEIRLFHSGTVAAVGRACSFSHVFRAGPFAVPASHLTERQGFPMLQLADLKSRIAALSSQFETLWGRL